MNQTNAVVKIRKTKIHISRIETKSGFYSHNMYSLGFFLRIEPNPKRVYFIVDITVNLRVRNKQGNDYQDAIDFIGYLDELQEIWFDRQDLSNLKLYVDSIKGAARFVEFVYSEDAAPRSFSVEIDFDSSYLKLIRVANNV